jgi:hypothetical protein
MKFLDFGIEVVDGGAQRPGQVVGVDPRVMALLQALAGFTHLPREFRNRDLRLQWNALLPAEAQGASVDTQNRPLIDT